MLWEVARHGKGFAEERHYCWTLRMSRKSVGIEKED